MGGQKPWFPVDFPTNQWLHAELPEEKDALRIGLKVLIDAAPDDAEARRVMPTTWDCSELMRYCGCFCKWFLSGKE